MHPHVRNKRTGESYEVYIGRPSFWGNPIPLNNVHDDRERKLCVAAYIEWLTQTSEGEARLARVDELKGKTLGCWCAPKLCHGHVLAYLANADDLNQALEYCETRMQQLRKEANL